MSNQKINKQDKQAKENLNSVQNQYKVKLNKPGDENRLNDHAGRILRASNVTLIGGPFHYHVRSGTYGDPYDEIPWKVRIGMAEPKERHGYPENAFAGTYEPRVLLNNWVEEKRDKNWIKYCGSRLSQYGHHYRSEYTRSFNKPVCNKQRDILLNIATFPMVPHPAHQPELDLHTLMCSAPKPEDCVVAENIAKCEKEMERQKRYYKASL